MGKRLIITLVVIGVLAAGGYAGIQYGLQYGKKMIAERVMDEVIEQVLRDEEVRRLLDDPEVRRTLREAAEAEDLERLRSDFGTQLEKFGATASASASGDAEGGQGEGTGVSGAGGTFGSGGKQPAIDSLEEAEALVLEKFSLGEIRRYAAMASGGLTEEEKRRIRDDVMSRFSEDELRSLMLVALIEAERRTAE